MSSVSAAPPIRQAARDGARGARRVRTIYRWELRKLVSQKRTYLGLGLAVLLPLIFVVSQLIRGHPPRGADSIFASEIIPVGARHAGADADVPRRPSSCR